DRRNRSSGLAVFECERCTSAERAADKRIGDPAKQQPSSSGESGAAVIGRTARQAAAGENPGRAPRPSEVHWGTETRRADSSDRGFSLAVSQFGLEGIRLSGRDAGISVEERLRQGPHLWRTDSGRKRKQSRGAIDTGFRDS